jgi:hypothetical protein
MAARLEAVRAAKAKLQDKHFIWIIDAALEHYVGEAKKVETEIVRYQTLTGLPLFSKFGRIGPVTSPATRKSELPRLHGYLSEYYAILEFLQALKDAEVIRSAEVFAEEMGGSFGLGGRAPRGRAPR